MILLDNPILAILSVAAFFLFYIRFIEWTDARAAARFDAEFNQKRPSPANDN